MLRRFAAKVKKEVTFEEEKYSIWVKYFVKETNKVTGLESDLLQTQVSSFYIEDISPNVIIDNVPDVIDNSAEVLPRILKFDEEASPAAILFCELLQNDSENSKDVLNDVYTQLIRCFIKFSYQIKREFRDIILDRKIQKLPKYTLESIHTLVSTLLDIDNGETHDFIVVLKPFLTVFIDVEVENVKHLFNCTLTKSYVKIVSILTNYLLKNPETPDCDSKYILKFICNYFVQVFSNKIPGKEFYSDFESFAKLINKISSREKLMKICIINVINIIANSLSLATKKVSEDVEFAVNIGLSSIDLLPSIINENPVYGIIMHNLLEFIAAVINLNSQTKLTEDYKVYPTTEKKFLVSKLKVINECLLDTDETDKQLTRGSMMQCDPTILKKVPYVFEIMDRISNICYQQESFVADYVKEFLNAQEEYNSLILLLFSLTLFLMHSHNASKAICTTEKWNILIPFGILNESVSSEGSYINKLVQMNAVMAFTTIGDAPPPGLFKQLNKIMLSYEPTACYNAIEMCKVFLLADYNKFQQGFTEANMINSFISINDICKNKLKKEKDPQLMKIRGSIVALFSMICKRFDRWELDSNTQNFFYFAISLLYEKTTIERGIDFIFNTVRCFPVDKFFIMMREVVKGCYARFTEPEWLRVVYSLIEAIIAALPYNGEEIVKQIVDTKFYAVLMFFPVICTTNSITSPSIGRFQSNDSLDGEENKITGETAQILNDIAYNVLSFFLKLTQCSQYMQKTLEEKTSGFVMIFTLLYRSVKVELNMIELLVKYLTQEPKKLKDGAFSQFKNLSGIKLLYKAALNSDYYNEVLDFFIDATTNSSFNRHQCSEVCLIDIILSSFKKNFNEKALKLLITIGTSYIQMSELYHILKLIKKTDEDYSLVLIKALSEMVHPQNPDIPVSFFHFTNDNTAFILEDIKLSLPFSISAKIELEPESFASKRDVKIFTLESASERFEMLLKDSVIVFNISDSEQTNQIPVKLTLQPNKWTNIEMQFNDTGVKLVLNNEQSEEARMESPFHSKNQEPMKMNISKIFGNYELITFYNKQKEIVGQFSATYTSGNTVLNAVRTNVDMNTATFSGLLVSNSLTIVDTLPSCGGPRILLPLFEVVEKSKDPQEFLKYLFILLHKIIKEKEELLENQHLFSTIGHFLSELNISHLKNEVLVSLFKIYNTMKEQTLKDGMITGIWDRSDIWAQLPDSGKILLLKGIFPGIFQTTNHFTFLKLFLIFLLIVNDSENEETHMKCWNMISLIRQFNFGATELELVIGSFYDWKNPLQCYHAQNFLITLTVEDCSYINDILDEYGLDLFIANMQSPDYRVRAQALQLFYIYSDRCENIHDKVLQAVEYLATDNHEKQVNDLVLSFILGLPKKEKVDVTQTRTFSESSIIVNSFMIPIYAAIVGSVTNEETNWYSSFLFNKIINDQESAKNTIKLQHWPFWLIFIASYNWDSYWKEALGALLKIIVNEEKAFKEALDEMVVILYITYDDPSLAIREILLIATEQDASKGALKEVIKHLLYTIDPENTEKRQVSLLELSERFESNREIPVRFDFSPQITSEAEFNLAISTITSCIDFLGHDKCEFVPEYNYTIICALIILLIGKYSENDATMFVPFLFSKVNEGNEEYNPFGILMNTFNKGSLKIQILEMNGALRNLKPITLGKLFTDITEGQQIILDEAAESFRRVSESLAKEFNIMLLPNKIPQAIRKFLSFFMKEMDKMKNSVERNKRRNKKQCNEALNEIQRMIGGMWSSSQSELHYKTSDEVDLVGRKMLMKRKKHFNDHKDASELRDSGNDFVTKERNITQKEKDESIDDDGERIISISFPAKLITVQYTYTGTVFISSESIEFDSNEKIDSTGEIVSNKTKIIRMMKSEIVLVLKRRYLHIKCGVEVFSERYSHFMVFDSEQTLNKFISEVQIMAPPNLKGIETKSAAKLFQSMEFEKKWHNGTLSNYEYLYWINMFSGRSFHDISQYPVYPWVLSNYTSDNINLDDPNNYRDLTKSIGELNSERYEILKEAYNDVKGTEFGCFYRLHYSTAAYVINFLVRMEPFTSLQVQLQDGRFEIGNRQFLSIQASWESVVSCNSDFRELIPEFFSNSEFLYNTNKFDLGYRDDIDDIVDAVTIPKWANNAEEFIAMNRVALESNYVSENLNSWINLIFGCLQRGEAAESINNTYHPFSYPESIQNAKENGQGYLIETIQHYAANFGIIPEQLFTTPHLPRRFSIERSYMTRKTILRMAATKVLAKEKVFYLETENSTLYAVSKTSVLKYAANKSELNLQHTEKVNFTIPSHLLTNNLFAYRTKINHHSGCILMAVPWSSSFNIYPFSKKKQTQRVSKFHAGNINAIDVSNKLIVTGAQDSSIVVGDATNYMRTTYIVAHKDPIVAVAANSTLDLIVSADSKGNIAFSLASKGTFIRSIKLDSAPKFLHVTDIGFVISISNIEFELSKCISINVIDINGRIVYANTLNEVLCVSSCVLELRDASLYIAIALSDKRVIVFDLISNTFVCDATLPEKVISMAFLENEMLLCCATESGNLYTTNLFVKL